MTDTMDRAGDYVDEWTEAMVNAARPAMPSGPSLTICVDCDGEIPEARRLAVSGCIRCMPCEADHQQRTRQHG